MKDVVDLFPDRRRFGLATVTAKKQLSPHMVRITLRSDFTARFPENCVGGYLKLIVPPEGINLNAFSAGVEAGTYKQRMRTYTIRHIRREKHEIDVDFVIHGSEGVAGPWAAAAEPGDMIALSKPGDPKLKKDGADRYIVAADMAAIPAAAAGLESLPADTQGEAWFEILSDADIQPVDAPSGITINWIVKADPAAHSEDLITALKQADEEERTAVFVAGEHAIAGEMRDHFRNTKPVPKNLLYVSSYWKNGLIEQEHKKVKVAV